MLEYINFERKSNNNQQGIDNIKKIADDFTNKIGDEIVEESKTLAPVDTGNLRSSIKNIKEGDGVYKIIALATYSLWVEFKTRFLYGGMVNVKSKRQ